MGKTSSAVKDRYNKKAYDRITFRVPKGMKAEIQKKAEEKGFSSINSFIAEAVKNYQG